MAGAVTYQNFTINIDLLMRYVDSGFSYALGRSFGVSLAGYSQISANKTKYIQVLDKYLSDKLADPNSAAAALKYVDIRAGLVRARLASESDILKKSNLSATQKEILKADIQSNGAVLQLLMSLSTWASSQISK